MRVSGMTCRAGDDAKAVDDERHGALHLHKLGARHALADVEHRDEIQRRRGHQRWRLEVHHHREPVVVRAVGGRRVLAVRVLFKHPAPRCVHRYWQRSLIFVVGAAHRARHGVKLSLSSLIHLHGHGVAISQ